MRSHRIGWLVLISACFLLASSIVHAYKDKKTKEQDNAGTTEVGKLQSFKVEARAGSYERWEINGLTRFDGVSMTATIDEIGKEGRGKRKQWGAGLRIIMDGDKLAGSESTPRFILALPANRQTRVIGTQFIINGSAFDRDISLSEKKPINISILRIDNDYIRIKIDENSYKVPCDVLVRKIAVSASGLKASVNNLVLLPPSTQAQ